MLLTAVCYHCASTIAPYCSSNFAESHLVNSSDTRGKDRIDIDTAISASNDSIAATTRKIRGLTTVLR